MDVSDMGVSDMNAPRQDRRIRAVLFDLDDTLLDWSNMEIEWGELTRRHLDNVYRYLAADGHDLPDEKHFFQKYIEILIQSWDKAKETWAGVHFADVLTRSFEACGLDEERIDLREVMLSYDWQPVPGIVPFDDAIPVLEFIKCCNYKIGLITNSMFPMWMRDIELRAYNLIDYFDVRITSGDTGYMKPHPAIYASALKMLNAQPEQALFVGDRPANDIAGANDSGLISVLISPPHLERELDGVCPDFTITQLSELLSILEILEKEAEVKHHEETGT
jgi:putative hydrolase of the HAD superfamily